MKYFLQVVTEWFGNRWGSTGLDVQAKDVFIAFTVDQGGNAVNAIKALGVEVVMCCAHRLKTVVSWMLGTFSSAATCKNPDMEKLTKRLAACVGKFSNSAIDNSKLNDIQELAAAFSKVCELTRRAMTPRDTLRIYFAYSYS